MPPRERDGDSRLTAIPEGLETSLGALCERHGSVLGGDYPGHSRPEEHSGRRVSADPLSSIATVHGAHEIWCLDSLDRRLSEAVPVGSGWDALLSDPPFSERTHRANQTGVVEETGRTVLSYESWGVDQIARFVDVWSRAGIRGWWVICTDHVLWPAWEAELAALGMMTFAPIPAITIGGGCRLRGDGPSSCSVVLCVARPRRKAYSSWGTLPGYYIGNRELSHWPGGKPLWLTRSLIRDYTRPGDCIVDPCCGAGSFAVAARELGRGSCSIDANPAAVGTVKARLELADERCRSWRGRRDQLLLTGIDWSGK